MKKKVFITISVLIVIALIIGLRFLPYSSITNMKSESSREFYGEPDVSYDYEQAKNERKADYNESNAIREDVSERKVIKSGYISLETEKFDLVFDSITNKTNEIGGYVRSSSISKNDVRIYENNKYKKQSLRNGYLEVKIPKENFDEFLNFLKSTADVISLNTNTQDITESYDITKSRLDALFVQESRILEIMKKAEKVTDLIQLENELNRIRTEIQIASNQLNGWNNQIQYSSISVNIKEVLPENDTITIKEKNVWELSKKGFIKTANFLIETVQYLIIVLISLIPVLIVIGIILVVVLIVRKKKFKKED